MVILPACLLLLPLAHLPLSVPLLYLLRLGQGLQGVGVGLLVPVVEVVPPSTEAAAASEATSTTIHGLRLASRVNLMQMIIACYI